MTRTRDSRISTARRYSACRISSRLVCSWSRAVSRSRRSCSSASSVARRSRLPCASSTADSAARSSSTTAPSWLVRTPSFSLAAAISASSAAIRVSIVALRSSTSCPAAEAAKPRARTSPKTTGSRHCMLTRFARGSDVPPALGRALQAACSARAPAGRPRPHGEAARPALCSPRRRWFPSCGRTRAPSEPRVPGRASRAAPGAVVPARRARPGYRTPAPAPGETAARPRRRRRPRGAPRAARQASRRRRDADIARTLDEAALLARVRPEGDERAEQEDQAGDPDEVDERLDEDAEVHRSVRIGLLGYHEQVLAGERVAPDANLVRDLLLDRVRVLPRLEGAEIVVASRNAQRRADLGRIRGETLVERLVLQPVVADRHRLPACQPR